MVKQSLLNLTADKLFGGVDRKWVQWDINSRQDTKSSATLFPSFVVSPFFLPSPLPFICHWPAVLHLIFGVRMLCCQTSEAWSFTFNPEHINTHWHKRGKQALALYCSRRHTHTCAQWHTNSVPSKAERLLWNHEHSPQAGNHVRVALGAWLMVLPAASARKLEAGLVPHCCAVGDFKLIMYVSAVLAATAEELSDYAIMLIKMRQDKV